MLLRYTSIQSYKALLQDITLPSLSLLQKINSGTIDAAKCVNALRIKGNNSEDICLIFDEMYLLKSEDYFRREMIGCVDEGELYKGIVCFMIVDFKEPIPYVIKLSTETNNDVNCLKTELSDSLKIYPNCGFCGRAIVCGNHPSKVSNFKKLLKHTNQNPGELYILQKSRKIYLCYDALCLIKNVCNNLLKYKLFIFPHLNFLNLRIQSVFLEGKLHGKSFMMCSKGSKLTCQFEESTKANDEFFTHR